MPYRLHPDPNEERDVTTGAPNKLHLGCGLVTPEGWINVDGSWNARMTKWPLVKPVLASLGIISKENLEHGWSKDIVYQDVRKPLKWAAGSMDAVYHSHLLEHLYRDKAQFFLEQCFRVLKPGGVLRVVVPDLEVILRDYVSEQGSETAADRVNERLIFRKESVGKMSARRLFSAMTEFHTHKYMYDGPSLCKYIRQAGFVDVEVREAFDSRLDDIREIERENRAGAEGLCAEAIKPG